MLGSEPEWARLYVPHAGNRFASGALGITGDHLNYLFYENDPGVPLPELADLSLKPDPTRTPPEWAWWLFDIDDVTRGEGDLMMGITDATDPDLGRFLFANDGKLILYHGWSDGLIVPGPTIDYYNAMVDTTFDGNIDAARERARLFLMPGMGHCAGGPGPNTWDRLPPPRRVGGARHRSGRDRGDAQYERGGRQRTSDLPLSGRSRLLRAGGRPERPGELGPGELQPSLKARHGRGGTR